MNDAIKRNRALQRKKNKAYFTESEWWHKVVRRKTPFQLPSPSPAAIKRLRDKWAEEQRRDRRRLAVGTMIALALVGLLLSWLLGVL